MSWANRVHKKNRADKMIDEIMNHPRYQEIKQKYRDEAVLDAYYAFCFVACEFLAKKHRYKREGMLKFLDFANSMLYEIDEDFFVKKIEEFKVKYGIDLPKVMNCEFESKGECDEKH